MYNGQPIIIPIIFIIGGIVTLVFRRELASYQLHHFEKHVKGGKSSSPFEKSTVLISMTACGVFFISLGLYFVTKVLGE